MALAIIRNNSAIRLSNKNISQTHKNKKKYSNFENFYPQIIDFFVNYAEKENKRLSNVK